MVPPTENALVEVVRVLMEEKAPTVQMVKFDLKNLKET